MNRAKVGKPLHAIIARLASLWRDRTAVSVVEFAISLPMIMTLGFYGIEIAYMSAINMQASQMALSLADNAARIGQTDNSALNPTVSERDINSILKGAIKQGESMGFQEKGRIFLSSLEVDNATGRQKIGWQRCIGSLTGKTSVYGNDTTRNGINGARITGVGVGRTIRAPVGSAVMIAEVYYRYDGLFGSLFVHPTTFHQEAIYLVRDGRDISTVSQNAAKSAC